MTETPATELVRLPYTGLRMPDTQLAVTSLRQWEMHDGVAFKATLRCDGKIVGTIENGQTY